MSDENEFGEVPRLIRLSGTGREAITTGQFVTLQKQFERMGIIIEPVHESDQAASETPTQDLVPTKEEFELDEESEFVERIVIEGNERLAVTKRSLINFADSIGIAENRCSKVLTDLIMNIATVCLGHYPTIYDRSNNKDEEAPQLLLNGVIYLGKDNVPPAWIFVAYGFEPKEFVKQINRALRDDTEFKRGFGKLTKLIVTKHINAIAKSHTQD